MLCERCRGHSLFILVTAGGVDPDGAGPERRAGRRADAFEAICGDCFDRGRDGAKPIYYAAELEAQPEVFLEGVRSSGGPRRLKDFVAWLGRDGLASLYVR